MSDDQVERHIDKVTLTNLFNSDMAAKRAASQEMMPIASRIRGLKESHGLNPEAYRLAKAIAKKPEGEREHLKRAVDLYCDMLGVGSQGDLLDVDQRVEDNVRRAGGRSQLEAEMDGQGERQAQENADRLDAGMVGSIIRPNTPAGKTALTGFENAMAEAVSAQAVNDGLDRFTKDNPYLAEKAGEIALARIEAIDKAIAEEAGEDVRSTEQREAPAKQVRETVEAAKTATKPRRRAKPDAGGEAAALH